MCLGILGGAGGIKTRVRSRRRFNSLFLSSPQGPSPAGLRRVPIRALKRSWPGRTTKRPCSQVPNGSVTRSSWPRKQERDQRASWTRKKKTVSYRLRPRSRVEPLEGHRAASSLLQASRAQMRPSSPRCMPPAAPRPRPRNAPRESARPAHAHIASRMSTVRRQ